MASAQDKVERNRPPRVHIKYEVNTGGAPEMRELPFVVGVIADLSGMPVGDRERLADRKFLKISRDNFDDVMKGYQPHLKYEAEIKVDGKEALLPVDLTFRTMKDFEPEQVVKNIPELNKILEARRQLKNLLNKLDGNDKLETLLQDVIRNTDSLKQIGREYGFGDEDKADGVPSEPSTPQDGGGQS